MFTVTKIIIYQNVFKDKFMKTMIFLKVKTSSVILGELEQFGENDRCLRKLFSK